MGNNKSNSKQIYCKSRSFEQQKDINNNYLGYQAPAKNGLITIFNDDQPVEVVQNFRKNGQGLKNNISYDLEKGLSVEIKSMHKYFKFDSSKNQTIPIMVSLKTKDQQQQEPKEAAKAELDSNRPHIDLICVIDNSGSMISGYKIENVKKALKYLLELLGENDRICLITFNSYGTRLFPLQKNNKANSEQINYAIEQIQPSGGTIINSGMEIAFKVLKERRTQNPVSSIFLLSDGQDDNPENAENSVQASIQTYLPDECFTIHSFGFGSDHDAPMMNKICSLKDGSFYYVEKIDQVDEFFVDALGGLFSVVAQEITLDININQSGPSKKFFSDATVSKTYGDMWNVVKQNQTYQIKVNQLFSGVSKDYIFELTVPAKNVDTIEDFERNSQLVTATVGAIPVDVQYSTRVVKEVHLTLTLFTNSEQLAEDSEVNDAVEFNYLRVKASEAIQQAMKLAEKREYDNGQNLLQGMISNLDSALPANREKLNIIKRDLVECQTNSKPLVYEQVGRMKMQTKMNANMNQISQTVEACDLYQNSGQERFVKAAKSKKGIF